ncbi:NIFU4 [Symbiodinium natans]|uniref:NIFU4 protein n=1 Tax=Symbiodinium natans TaxID=878477 RepID=A0A812RK16_9DINO|nr:NIFU4 [Symbiodinium natans]
MANYSGDTVLYYEGAAEEDPVLTFAFHGSSHKLVLDVAEERNRTRAGADKVAGFRQRYEKEVAAAKSKYSGIEPEFSDDDMNATIAEEDRKRGWEYPLTKTQQKREFGCVPADQQRFLWRLQDGHLDVVEDYLHNPKMRKAIDINRYDDMGLTPLHHAARLGHGDIVRALIEAKADPLLRDRGQGLTALDFAQRGRDWDAGPNEEAIKAPERFDSRRSLWWEDEETGEGMFESARLKFSAFQRFAGLPFVICSLRVQATCACCRDMGGAGDTEPECVEVRVRFSATRCSGFALLLDVDCDFDILRWVSRGSSRVPQRARHELLDLPGVRDVFVGEGSSWLAVTRQHGADWQLLSAQVQDLLQQLPEEEPAAEPKASAESAPGSEVQALLEEVLQHRIRPSVQDDGGDVELKAWDPASGEVLLQLKGACRGCPQSAVTLQESILKTLKHFVPEVQTVRAKEEEPDSTDPFADISWLHVGEAAGSAVRELVAKGTPIFSTFAGTKVEGAKLRRISFMSEIVLAGRTPEHILVTCQDCKAKRTIEDPQDLLRADKGNTTGNAAVAICPTCCVVISL